MQQRKTMRHVVSALTAGALTVASLPIVMTNADDTAMTYPFNTWTGYALEGMSGCLSVSGGTMAENIPVIQYQADGTADYNTWYFTEEGTGFTIKSALDEGQYYLSDLNGTLAITTTPEVFYYTIDAEGSNYGTLTSDQGNNFGIFATHAVTGDKICGDITEDGVINGMDLAQLRFKLSVNDIFFTDTALGDVNGDKTLNNADLTILQNYLINSSTTLATYSLPTCTIVPPYSEPISVTTETTTTETQYVETTESTTESTTYTTESTTEETTTTTTTTQTVETFDLSDMPSDYTTAMEWIWTNRFEREGSTTRWNTIFDQIVAGDGTLNFVVRWQSYKTITYEQRQQFETMAQDCVHAWTDLLVGYDDWPYQDVEVNIVGWAVLDKSCLLDLHDDEVVWTDTEPYDSSGDTSNGTETIPTLLPDAPSSLWRFEHFTDSSYVYPGTRFDMYLWCTQGFPSIGGCGGDWGQRLSDDAYLSMLDGSSLHVLEHELGHGFGITDFYGGEGENDGYPVGGFPGGENSIMMAGSATHITDFDAWMLRYIWSKIKDETGRFNY